MATVRRWLKLGGLAVLAAAVLCFAVHLIDRRSEGPEEWLRRCQSAHERGLAAWQNGDRAAAVTAFDEALLFAGRVLDEVERRRNQGTDEGRKAILHREGETYWLKAQVLRDRAYAWSEQVGRPLPASVDPITGRPYRDMNQLAEDLSRREAFVCLFHAAERLPGRTEVQLEALRAELQWRPVRWARVEKFARRLVDVEDGHFHGRFALAWLEFEQPPTPWQDRRPGRVRSALGHLDRLRDSGPRPHWGVVGLRAQVHSWLADYYGRTGKDAEANREGAALRRLLFDPTTGPLVRAPRNRRTSGARLRPGPCWNCTGWPWNVAFRICTPPGPGF